MGVHGGGVRAVFSPENFRAGGGAAGGGRIATVGSHGQNFTLMGLR
jgi:hypothetical protein